MLPTSLAYAALPGLMGDVGSVAARVASPPGEPERSDFRERFEYRAVLLSCALFECAESANETVHASFRPSHCSGGW